jgi:hypothetical protein
VSEVDDLLGQMVAEIANLRRRVADLEKQESMVEGNYLLASGARAGAQSEPQVFNNTVDISVDAGTLLTSLNRWYSVSREVGRVNLAWWADFDGTNWISRHSSLHPARIAPGAAGGIRIQTADNNGVGGTLGSWTTRLDITNDGDISTGAIAIKSSSVGGAGTGGLRILSNADDAITPALLYEFTAGVGALILRDGATNKVLLRAGGGPSYLNGGSVGIGTTGPATSALLELSASDKALLLTRLTTTQRNALTAVDGMIIYNSSTDKFQGRAGGAWVDLH